MMLSIVIVSGLNSYVFGKVSADVSKPEKYGAFDPSEIGALLTHQTMFHCCATVCSSISSFLLLYTF